MTEHDAACHTQRLQETFKAKLSVLGTWLYERDDLVRGAVSAGVPKMEIFRRTGIARSTIDRILRSGS